MSFAQRRNAISFTSSLLVSIPYFFYIARKFRLSEFTMAEELKFWAWSIIILMVIRIVAEIVGHIVGAILVTIITKDPQAAESDLTDERDKLIELKGERNSHYIFMAGFVFALISILTSGILTPMFVIIIAAGFLSEMASLISQYYYYQRGY